MRVRFADIELGRSQREVTDVSIENLDFSYPEIRTSDSENEGRDGSIPGRDFYGVRTVSFDLATNRRTMVEARETAAQFLAAWRARAIRDLSGVMVPLEVQAADDPQWRRVYGRPRRSDDPVFDLLMRQGVGRLTCEFDVLEPRVFSGGEAHERRLNHYGTSSGGWYAPFHFPLSSEAPVGVRAGLLPVGGTEPTPPVITFHGPGRQFLLEGNRGWRFALKPDVELAYDEVLQIDPLAGTVLSWHDGEPQRTRRRFGALRRGSGLKTVELLPGNENVFFSAIDQTNTSYALIQWRDAYASLA